MVGAFGAIELSLLSMISLRQAVGGKRSASLHFGFAFNCFEAFSVGFGSEFICCLKVCDMSHEMAISIVRVSRARGLRKSI